MIYFYGFLFCGGLCMMGQILYDNTKFTPGHITSLFVIMGSLLEVVHIYDKILEVCGIGASLPILSFGHSLTHAAIAASMNEGWIGVLSGMFDKTASGITFAIFTAFCVAVVFKPHD